MKALQQESVFMLSENRFHWCTKEGEGPFFIVYQGSFTVQGSAQNIKKKNEEET